MSTTSLAETLRNVPWFAMLKENQLQKMAAIAEEVSWPAGELPLREGQKGKYMFMVLEGQVALDIHVPMRGRVTILTVGPNEIFGWSSVLPVVAIATATVRTVQPTRAVAFDAKRLQEICEQDHEFGYAFYRRMSNIIAGRLTATRLQLLDMYSFEGKETM
ncbi:MAG: cyclic nucleotide-binding domain-containing protein [Anaerolineales bacterium]|nr:cyclic nucleotide-binding domain-containing protein [Anaerolineales bacterium]